MMKARTVEKELEKQEETRAKGSMKVAREERRKQLVMEVRGGREGIVMATRRKETGRRRASIDASKYKDT